jgi:hypothetical protein
MNARTIVIGIGVASGLVGLGFLAHYVYSGEQEDQSNEDVVKEVDKKELKNFSKPQTKSVVQKHIAKPIVKRKPLVKEVIKVNPTPQIEMIEVAEVKPPIAELARPLADEFPLRLGSEGKRVVRLQVWLMRNYGWMGKVTGIFDEKTATLLKKGMKVTQLDEATYFNMKMEKPVHEQTIRR